MRRIDAAAAIDGAGTAIRHPCGISAVIERRPDGTLTLAALGPTDQLAASTRWVGVPVTSRPGWLLIPGLVNAHTHLDLTHIGPRPHDPAGGFAPWIDMIRRERHTDQGRIGESIRHGVERSLAGGTVLIGDIAGAVGGVASPFAARHLAWSRQINAVSFIEFFAQGARGVDSVGLVYQTWRQLDSLPLLPTGGRVVFGVQPHAPYSVGLACYMSAFRSVGPDTPLCTHVGESLAEREFVASATGPLRQLLERIGVWDEQAARGVGRGASPIEHLAPVMASGRFSAVHCNDASDADIERLGRGRSPVIYCPRASAYFAAERDFGPHRYRDMLAAGITVALGTDSIVNLDTPDRISTWDEMRLLYQRDRTDPDTLLEMATINGAAALRRDTEPFTLTPMGTLAGLAAISVPNANPNANPSEMLAGALSGATPHGGENPTPELLAIGRV